MTEEVNKPDSQATEMTEVNKPVFLKLKKKRPSYVLIAVILYLIPVALIYPVYRVNCDAFENYYSDPVHSADASEDVSSCYKNGTFMAAFLIPPCALLIPLLGFWIFKVDFVCVIGFMVVIGFSVFVLPIALPSSNIAVNLPFLKSWGAIVVVCLISSAVVMYYSRYCREKKPLPTLNEAELGKICVQQEKIETTPQSPDGAAQM